MCILNRSVEGRDIFIALFLILSHQSSDILVLKKVKLLRSKTRTLTQLLIPSLIQKMYKKAMIRKWRNQKENLTP